MPILKASKKREPLWREWDKKAQKEGVRAPVYAVNGDEYTGEWSDNKKHGELIGAVYTTCTNTHTHCTHSHILYAIL